MRKFEHDKKEVNGASCIFILNELVFVWLLVSCFYNCFFYKIRKAFAELGGFLPCSFKYTSFSEAVMVSSLW